MTVLEVYLFQGGGEFNDGGIRRPGHSVGETFITMKPKKFDILDIKLPGSSVFLLVEPANFWLHVFILHLFLNFQISLD